MTGWLLRYDGWDSAESLCETVCALGNGRLVTRAAAPARRAGDGCYPGAYAAGVFDQLTDEVDGRGIPNESIVNLPDWQSLTFRLGDGPWLDLSALLVTDHGQLDLPQREADAEVEAGLSGGVARPRPASTPQHVGAADRRSLRRRNLHQRGRPTHPPADRHPSAGSPGVAHPLRLPAEP